MVTKSLLERLARIPMVVEGEARMEAPLYSLSDVHYRVPDAQGHEIEGAVARFPLTVHAWLTERGKRALEALAKRGVLLRFDSYAFPRVFKNGGFAVSTGDPNQKHYEELKSLLGGMWVVGVPNTATEIASRLLLALGQENADAVAPLLVSAANRYQAEHFFGMHSAETAKTQAQHMNGLVEMALHGEEEKLRALGWGPGWSEVSDPITGAAKELVEEAAQAEVKPLTPQDEAEAVEEEELYLSGNLTG